MSDDAPSCYVAHVRYRYAPNAFVAKCGVFYEMANDPYRAAYLACRACRSEPYPYWRTHRSGEGFGWHGIMGRRIDDVATHNWHLINEEGAP